jgi:hypothetical protein
MREKVSRTDYLSIFYIRSHCGQTPRERRKHPSRLFLAQPTRSRCLLDAGHRLAKICKKGFCFSHCGRLSCPLTWPRTRWRTTTKGRATETTTAKNSTTVNGLLLKIPRLPPSHLIPLPITTTNPDKTLKTGQSPTALRFNNLQTWATSFDTLPPLARPLGGKISRSWRNSRNPSSAASMNSFVLPPNQPL